MNGHDATQDPGIAALIEAGCWTLDLCLPEEARAGVAYNLARTARMAAFLGVPDAPPDSYGRHGEADGEDADV